VSKSRDELLGKLNQVQRESRQKDEQLRELLSFCRASTQNPLNSPYYQGATDAFDHVAKRLTEILDGEQ